MAPHHGPVTNLLLYRLLNYVAMETLAQAPTQFGVLLWHENFNSIKLYYRVLSYQNQHQTLIFVTTEFIFCFCVNYMQVL